jgi:flagellar protein FliT
MKPRARSTNPPPFAPTEAVMSTDLLSYYEAIERASQDMLEAARGGNWDEVVKLEGACAVLIAQLKHAASRQPLAVGEAQLKSRIMQRILVNDAEIRQLAEPWLEDLEQILAGRTATLH